MNPTGPTRRRLALIGLAAALSLVFVFAFLIDDGSQASGELIVRSDDQEKGDPALGSERIRITPKGLWTRVFWVKLEGLNRSEVILSRVNIQLTWCRPSDRVASVGSSCAGTAHYDFSPTVEWKLLLARGQSGGEPALSGTPIGRTHRMVCTATIHHCVPVAFGELEVGPSDEGDRYVVLAVRAYNEQARTCRRATPRNCDVLQLSHDEGRLGVVRESGERLTPHLRRNSSERAAQLRVAETGNQKGNYAQVVYSEEFDAPGPVLVKARLDASFDASYPVPPLVAKSLVIADSPDATSGATIEPQNGENCQGRCAYLQPGVVPCISEQDIAAGRRYLNLVAFSSRESAFASPKQRVSINGGGYLATQQYDASLAPEVCSDGE